MKRYRKYIALTMCLIMLFGLNINSYASDNNKLYYTLDDFVKDAEGFLQNICGVVFPFGVKPSEYNQDYLDFDAWFQDDEHGGGGHSRGESTLDFVNDNVSKDDEGNYVTTPQFNNVINNYANYYIEKHPMSYSIQTIYSYNKMSSLYFKNLEQYNSVKNYISSLEGVNFVIIPRYDAYSDIVTTSNTGIGNCKVVLSYNQEIDWYFSNGHLNNYTYNQTYIPTHNWTSINPYGTGSYGVTTVINGWVKKCFDGNGNDVAMNTWNSTANKPYKRFANSNYTTYSSNDAIFNTTEKDMHVFVYDSIDAIKVHDTGQPSPYYVLPNYKGPNYNFTDNSVISPSSIVNNRNLYDQVINIISSDMDADDLIININIIIQENESKPLPTPTPTPSDPSNPSNPSNPNGGDSIWDTLFGSLADFIGGFFGGIASVIAQLIDGLSSIFDSIFELINGLLENTFSEEGSIFLFLKKFIEWLPEPMPSVLTTLFTITVIFAVVKLIKGALS